MSWRTTGILFLILLIAAAAVLALQQRYSAEARATPSPPPSSFVEVVDLFGGVVAEDVVRLEITRTEPEDEAVFALEEDGSWVQTVPTTTHVFSPTLTNHITGLLNTRARRSFSTEGGDLAPYGLDSPRAAIIVAAGRDGAVARYELALGNQAPTGDAYYVQRRGDPRVHLLASAALDGVLGLLEHVPLPEAEAVEP